MPVDKRNIVLVGMPAAGKSTLGVLLAKRLRYNFIDTDITIQVENDATLAELIAAYGNARLLEIEAGVLRNVRPTRCVIATGGSAVYSDDSMCHLKTTGPIVYLHVSYEELLARVGDLTERGVVVPEGYSFRDIFDERTALYEKYADITVPTSGLTVDEALREVSEKVTAWLDARGSLA